MKIKFLALAMIAMLFTACKPDPQPEGGEGSDPNKGEVENSYIAISIASADKERGEDLDGFDEGTAAERAVESAYIFFFKTGGEGFVGVNDTDNHQEISLDSLKPISGATGNVSDISNSVIVIRNHKGELPSQMVAVLNWRPTDGTVYTIDALRDALVSNTNDHGYFIMSNSVYKNAAEDLYATPLAITDFKKSANEAKAYPVKVYVERVAAKVVVKTETADHKFALLKKNGVPGEFLKINGEQVYAKILGWELYNENTQSKLLKNIDGLPAHNDNTTLGFYWNDATRYRSYWAANTQTPTDVINYDAITTYPEYLYCGENTSAENTKVILKAQLQKAAGNPIEVAKWYGNDYIGTEQLVKAVRGTLVSKYYSRTITGTDTTYTSIQYEDLMIVNGTGSDAAVYQVYFKLKTGVTGYGEDKVWCERSGSKFTQIDNATLNADIKTTIGTALLYPNGETYYFTDIKHFGDKKGVVRNHVYDINIKTISGYGTPVISDIVIPSPEIPVEDQETFVSAEINILSWKIVSYDVNL